MIHFLLTNGIGQNITAAVILGVPSAIWAKVKLWPRLKEHERKVHELHEHLIHKD